MDSTLIQGILSSAGAGTALIVILILSNILFTRKYVDRVELEAAQWKAAAEAKDAVVAAAQAATQAAIQRADAAVEVAELTKELLTDLRRRTDAAQKTA